MMISGSGQLGRTPFTSKRLTEIKEISCQTG
jgi:hypothetical protein